MKPEMTAMPNRRSAIARLATVGAAAGAAAGAITAAPALAAGGPDRSEWCAAMSNYLRAKTAMRREPGNEVVDRIVEAEQAILGTRTPDLAAFCWKLELFRENSKEFVLEMEDFDCLLADLQALGAA